MGTDGVEFIELAASDPVPLTGFLSRAGYSVVARHRSKDVTLYRQGEINSLVNAVAPAARPLFAADRLREHRESSAGGLRESIPLRHE